MWFADMEIHIQSAFSVARLIMEDIITHFPLLERSSGVVKLASGTGNDVCVAAKNKLEQLAG